MFLAFLLPLLHELIDRLRLELAPAGQHPHLRFPALELVDDHAPAAEAADVFISRRPIDELEQRWRAPVKDREEQAEAERIGVAADRQPEVPRDFIRDLP